MIGATTVDEYRFIKSDPALSRRFQPVVLEAFKKEDILKILKGVNGLYEDHHNVKYTKKALEAIIELTAGIEGRSAPDLQIDLMDEAGSAATKSTINARDIKKVFEAQYGAEQVKVKKIGF